MDRWPTSPYLFASFYTHTHTVLSANFSVGQPLNSFTLLNNKVKSSFEWNWMGRVAAIKPILNIKNYYKISGIHSENMILHL